MSTGVSQKFGVANNDKAPPGAVLLTDLNTLLRAMGARRSAEGLARLLGVVAIQVLALEAGR